MYHISDIKKIIRCERLYFYSKNEETTFKPYLRTDESIIDLVIKYLKIDNYFEGVRNDTTDRFFENKDKYEWFVRPRFSDEELRINIPIMHKVNEGYDLYFVYFGTAIKELDTLTYNISIKVLENNNIKVNKLHLICLNGDYVNEGEIEVDKLFICLDKYKEQSIISLSRKNDVNYKSLIEKMKKEIKALEPVRDKWYDQRMHRDKLPHKTYTPEEEAAIAEADYIEDVTEDYDGTDNEV